MCSGRISRLVLVSLCGLVLLALVSLACNQSASQSGVEATLAPGAGKPTPIEPQTSLATPVAPEPQATASLPAILESRRLILEWPPTIRAGDSDVVRLSLEVDREGNLEATAEFAGHKTRSEIVQIPDLYDTHNVFAEARLDMVGMQVAPDDLVSQPLLRGQEVTFYWSIQPPGVNTYRGSIWFYLRFVPLDGGPQTQRPITVQPIEIRSVNMLGLSGAPARILGVAGTLVGSIFGLDNVLPWVWKKIRRKKGENT